MRRDIFALAMESAKNSKSSQKLSWCLALFVACSVIVIIFCGSFVYITSLTFDSVPNGRILAVSQTAEGQPGALNNKEEIDKLINNKDVEDHFKFNMYEFKFPTIQVDGVVFEYPQRGYIRSVDTDDGNVLFKYMRGIGAVTGSEIVNEGEAIITRDVASAMGYGDKAGEGVELIGKTVSMYVDKLYRGGSCYLDNDTDPDNLPLNSIELNQDFIEYPAGNLNIQVIKDFKIVGILETNNEIKALLPLGIEGREAGKYYEMAPFSAGETGIWINSKSIYSGEEMLPQVRSHSVYDSSYNIIDAMILTYGFTDYSLKSQQVTDSNKVFIMQSSMVSNGARIEVGASLAPIDNYYVQFESFAKGKKWCDINLEMLRDRFYTNFSQEYDDALTLKNEWGRCVDSMMTPQFSNLYTSHVILDFAFKIVAVFGSLLMIALIISIINIISIYVVSKRDSYDNLVKLGVDNKTLKCYRRADAIIASGKGIVIGGIISAAVAAGLYVGMFMALKGIVALGVKDIWAMLGLSVGTFGVISGALLAILTRR